ncbi:MAG: diacylglycerol kinase [Woeseiaceae bacterium]|nr:diacylglycerol kinase [Woeseiaceae bacterium]
MGKPGNTGLRRIVRATKYSAQGFAHAWKHEAAFRQELTITLILVPFAIWLGRTPVERLMLIGSCVLVLIVELLNSAIEATVDRFGGEVHELSGRAKDLASAAVFVSLVVVAAVWATVAWQRFVAPTYAMPGIAG